MVFAWGQKLKSYIQLRKQSSALGKTDWNYKQKCIPLSADIFGRCLENTGEDLKKALG